MIWLKRSYASGVELRKNFAGLNREDREMSVLLYFLNTFILKGEQGNERNYKELL